MGRRAQDARCSVCFASIFGDLDDVNEPRTAVATECGHVIHEHCMLRWIEMSADAQLANKQIDHRDEAEATCPQCRSEIYADEETGKPLIHRLYPVFDDEQGSSQVRSSPVKAEPVDEGLMGMARRAKGMKSEIDELGPESTRSQLERGAERVEGLKKDLEVSAKSISAVRTHVGGLIASINNLRSTITDYPLTPQLRDENMALRAQLDSAHLTMRRIQTEMNQKLMAEVRIARREEQEKAVRLVEEQMERVDQVKAELGKAMAEKNASGKLAMERTNEMRKKVERLEAQMKRNIKDKEDAEESEGDKRKQLKRWMDKYEKLEKKSNEYKRENTTLAEEITALKAKLAFRPNPTTHDLSWAEGDSSVTWVPPPDTASSNIRPGPPPRRVPSNHRTADESSLMIDMPSFHDSFSRELQSVPPQRSATAKTFSSDLFAGKKEKKSKYFGAGENGDDISDLSLKRKRNNSFSLSGLPEASIAPSSPSFRVPDTLTSSSPPLPRASSSSNPFMRSKDSRATPARPAQASLPSQFRAPPNSNVLVPPSSPPVREIVSPWDGVDESPSPPKKVDNGKGKGKGRAYLLDEYEDTASSKSTLPSRSENRPASQKTARLPLSSRSLQPSTDSIPSSHPSSLLGKEKARGSTTTTTTGKDKAVNKTSAQQSILSMFADKSGRPKAGVVTGSKSRKRI
ncbi:hypothetical protein B9479_003149 [Cryptococcus floricola]|uniref:RING-type domain-containing protein n=1 Tax=Cryptococcus floricola TaxID=2591691 RepID=A0A5D3B1L6_9TREE|nr:hypothetical protein B9479_003149 [Cryptococcus floricola]